MKQFLLGVVMLLLTSVGTSQAQAFAGAGLIDYAGYKGCVLLQNKDTRVVLDPNLGGRVLEYSSRPDAPMAHKGQNAIFLDPAQNGWTYTPEKPGIDPTGGRLDIGPEMVIPQHPALWLGRWKAEIIGPRATRLVSQEDKATGVQLVREFRLDKTSSHLKVTQTIRNTSKETKHWCHWSRTLAKGGGVCLIPLSPGSRFPQDYITYGPGSVMDYHPKEQPAAQVRDGFLQIFGEPQFPKFGIDSYAGWLAYLTRDNLLFVKRFPVYPNKPYNEMAAITISIYYFKDVMCELEPIGPKTNILPGKSASYTEDWWLLPYPFPKSGEQVNLKALSAIVTEKAR